MLRKMTVIPHTVFHFKRKTGGLLQRKKKERGKNNLSEALR